MRSSMLSFADDGGSSIEMVDFLVVGPLNSTANGSASLSSGSEPESDGDLGGGGAGE